MALNDILQTLGQFWYIPVGVIVLVGLFIFGEEIGKSLRGFINEIGNETRQQILIFAGWALLLIGLIPMGIGYLVAQDITWVYVQLAQGFAQIRDILSPSSP